MRIILIVIFVIAQAALGQGSFPVEYADGENEAVKNSPSAAFRMAELDSTELDSMIEVIRVENNVVGVSACIVKNDGVFWQGQYGLANIEENRPVTDSTVFMLASVSKPVTATALMQLYEDGLIGLDDDLNEYLPYSIGVPLYPDSAITARMLLTHTSSIRDNWDILDPLAGPGDPTIMLDEFTEGYLVPGGQYWGTLNYYSRIPGTTWSYSNVAVTLAAYVVEVLSGTTFENYCQENIFLPLGMEASSWFIANLDTNNIAMLYNWTGTVYEPYGHMGRPWYPAGQLRTSAWQLGQFLGAFMGGGEWNSVRLLDSTTVEEMWTIQFPGWVDSMGLIWNWEYRANRWTWAHGGSSWGTRTAMSYCPAEWTGVIVLTNGQSGWAVAQIEELLYEFALENAGVADGDRNLPVSYSLQVYPNPFNHQAAISFKLQASSQVELKVFDITGREVASLVTGHLSLGKHKVVWDAEGMGSGVYFVRMEVDGGQLTVNGGRQTEARKVVLVK